MPRATLDAFTEGVIQSQLLSPEQCEEVVRLKKETPGPRELAQELLRRDWLTAYQVNQIFQDNGPNLIIGPYVLLERVGEGGMGQVFKAMQKVLNRVVALKVIRKERLENPKAIRRFQREIRAAGQLSHPHIVRAYDADEVHGTYYIAMEYIDGVDLARLVGDHGPLSVVRACEYIRQAALGLQHAFERGMVHRDIKPANLLVGKALASDRRRSSGVLARPDGTASRPEPTGHYPWGVVKVLDMGLALCADPFTGREATTLTLPGSVIGTPDYVAPEQLEDPHGADIRADLYSLGCTLYFLLAGDAPFPNGSITDKLLAHQHDEPEPVEKMRAERIVARLQTRGVHYIDEKAVRVPVAVQAVLTKLLAKDPKNRHQTPMELADELQVIVARLADGTLDKASPLLPEPVEEELLLVSSTELMNAAAPTVIGSVEGPSPQRQRHYLAAASLTLFGLGALGLMVIATVIGVVMSRGNASLAGIASPDPAPKLKTDEPYWKLTLKNAVLKKITLEEARQELLRYRTTTAGGAQVKKIDEVLAKMPSPFDALDRTRFDGAIPAGMPKDVVGVYGVSAAKLVHSVVVSPNGRWLATNEDKGIRIFDLTGSSTPYRIQAHTGRVARVVMSSDGLVLASASDDGTVRIWDVVSRIRVRSFDKHGKAVTQVAITPDKALIGSAGRDGFIRVWKAGTGVEAAKFATNIGDVTALAFSPDGTHIFWGGATKEIRWADVSKPGDALDAFETQTLNQRLLAFQPNGNLVVLGGGQGLLQVCAWDGKTLIEKTTLKQQQQVHQVAFAPDGKTFVSVGVEPAAVLWDAQKLEPIKSFNQMRTTGVSAAYAPDGRHILVGGASNQVLVIRLASHDMDVLKQMLE
jgi:serine/threonine protein kinase